MTPGWLLAAILGTWPFAAGTPYDGPTAHTERAHPKFGDAVHPSGGTLVAGSGLLLANDRDPEPAPAPDLGREELREQPSPLAKERAALLKEIDRDMRATADLTGRSKLTPAVRAALARVPREQFVDPSQETLAYLNRPLGIGHGQTISQPFIVALMTELVNPRPDSVVLEIGTGSGYQAAVLSGLVSKVYSIEVIGALARSAAERLQRLGYTNVEVREGDGNLGWPEHAPFDGIVVTAAATEIPPALVAQLKAGARMIIPVGDSPFSQSLVVVERTAEGRVTRREVLPVAFVPLVGGKR